MEQINVGTIKCYFPFKGYGFITRDHGKDLFFFYKDIQKEEDIYENAKVSFVIDPNPKGKGPKALNIKRIG